MARTSPSDERVRSCADAVTIASKKMMTRISSLLQHDVEAYRGVRRALLVQRYRAHQLAILRDAALAVVLVGIALEKRIGGEVHLRHQRLVAWRRDQVVDVLRGPVVVMAWHHRFNGVFAARGHGQLGAIAEPD